MEYVSYIQAAFKYRLLFNNQNVEIVCHLLFRDNIYIYIIYIYCVYPNNMNQFKNYSTINLITNLHVK